jgi:hypothetical protein
MSKASRDKGKRGELEVAHVFTDAGLPADRTAALQAGSVPGAGDVTIRELPRLHVESKRTKTYSLPEWLRQVEEARLPDQSYVIAFRKDGTPKAPEPWRGIVDLVWLAELLAEVQSLRGEVDRYKHARRVAEARDAAPSWVRSRLNP